MFFLVKTEGSGDEKVLFVGGGGGGGGQIKHKTSVDCIHGIMLL